MVQSIYPDILYQNMIVDMILNLANIYKIDCCIKYMGDRYIAWLADLSKKDLQIAGGKGANVAEMYNAKFPVPPAFIVTTDAFHYFIKESKLEDKIKSILKDIDPNNIDGLDEKAKQIRDLMIAAEMPKKLRDEILEAYDHFNIDLNELRDSPGALAILKSSRGPVFVSVRSSATAEDLSDASFAGQQDSFINVKGNSELIEKIKECFASIFTARSIFYRKKKGFDDFVGIAAIIQKMINSDKSGVMFSKNPVNSNDNIVIEAVFGQGEGIVSGKIKPDQYVLNRNFEIISEKVSEKDSAIVRTAGGQTKTIKLSHDKANSRVLETYELKQLAEYALKLEEHYDGKAQDIEFSIENDTIYILQTRPITTLGKRSSKQPAISGHVLTSGMPASPGVASGVVRIISSMDDLDKVKQGDILVTTMTNPDMVVTMQKASAIVTSEGGVTAHAAIVSREMGIPAVVGAQDALDILKDGDKVTVDGFNGKVFSGIMKDKSVEILPIVKTKTKIKVLVDLPQFAERAAKTNAYGVGLVRLEGLIATSGKHPLAYEKEDKLDDYKKMLIKGLGEIAKNFEGKPIWVRSSDIRSDEYANLDGAPKKIEKNPMLGDHGIRFSLKHLGIFKAELLALKELAGKGHKLGVMFPQIISVDEVKKARKVFNELKIDNVKFGIMVETPAASILIKDICNEGIDFISFGTNDLTQYTLAIDRGNENVQNIYDEMNWAVLKQISRVIRECKKHNVETSICGQAGSKKEMVKFLVKHGIDSISVNADVAKDISELVQKLESENNGVVDSKNIEHKSQIEPINDKNDIKKEISIIKDADMKVEKKLENPEAVVIEDEKVNRSEGNDSKKEDIFN